MEEEEEEEEEQLGVVNCCLEAVLLSNDNILVNIKEATILHIYYFEYISF